VSFDPFVCHEDQPITADEARAKVELWVDGAQGVFHPHPEVLRFYDALLERFPPLERLSDAANDRLGVWSSEQDCPVEYGDRLIWAYDVSFGILILEARPTARSWPRGRTGSAR
jgi:hypothetical protein